MKTLKSIGIIALAAVMILLFFGIGMYIGTKF